MLEYLLIGIDYSATREQRIALETAFKTLEWQSIESSKDISGPAMPVMGLKQIIVSYRLPAVAVAWAPLGHPFSGLGLLSVKLYDGMHVHFIDHGDAACPVALETPREQLARELEEKK